MWPRAGIRLASTMMPAWPCVWRPGGPAAGVWTDLWGGVPVVNAGGRVRATVPALGALILGVEMAGEATPEPVPEEAAADADAPRG